MAATELKRYNIRPDCWEEFLGVWRGIVTLRRRHGFHVLFAFIDRGTNVFTWAIEHRGDFDAAAQGYYKDPDRVQLDHVVDYTNGFEIRRVEIAPIPD